MPITTRDYYISASTPINVIKALETAFTDLNWNDALNEQYLLTFINTPASVLEKKANMRYLVTQSFTCGSGSGAVFDVLRNQFGGVAAITLVNGGKSYEVKGGFPASSVGGLITLPETTNLYPGMVVNKIYGTGTLAANTIITSVNGPTQISINPAPSVALSNAGLLFSDTLTLSAESIGGSTYLRSATGSISASFITVDDTSNLLVGQRVSGSGIGNLATVSAVQGKNVLLSFANPANVSGAVVFSDEVTVTALTIANKLNLTGFATMSGTASFITNIATTASLYLGAGVNFVSGGISSSWTGSISEGGPLIVALSGAGPYTASINNIFGNYTGFSGTGSITFDAKQGSNSEFFDKDISTSPLSSAWAIAKSTNAGNKKLGTTFWNMFVTLTTAGQIPTGGVTPVLYLRAMPGFNPSSNASQGVAVLDFFNNASPNQTATLSAAVTIASNTYTPVTLKVRQSSIDPNFAVFDFVESTNNNRNPFFIARYNNSYQPWDLNDVFLSGVYEVAALPSINTLDAGIWFRMRMSGIAKRAAESGYSNYFQVNNTTFNYTSTYFRTMSGNRQSSSPGATYDQIAFYTRTEGDIQNGVSTVAIYKNLPINPYFAPVPYFLPEDFVIAEIPFGNANIGDTITVSPSEIYTVIQTAINQSTFTSIVFAARTT